jgi:hypothetical protein
MVYIDFSRRKSPDFKAMADPLNHEFENPLRFDHKLDILMEIGGQKSSSLCFQDRYPTIPNGRLDRWAGNASIDGGVFSVLSCRLSNVHPQFL